MRHEVNAVGVHELAGTVAVSHQGEVDKPDDGDAEFIGIKMHRVGRQERVRRDFVKNDRAGNREYVRAGDARVYARTGAMSTVELERMVDGQSPKEIVVAGPPGQPGIQGNTGKKGAHGINGPRGKHGADGHDGLSGPPGLPGIPGATGAEPAPQTPHTDIVPLSKVVLFLILNVVATLFIYCLLFSQIVDGEERDTHKPGRPEAMN